MDWFERKFYLYSIIIYYVRINAIVPIKERINAIVNTIIKGHKCSYKSH